jgi:hypothetical protein
MSRVTLREALIAGLEALGYQRPRRPRSQRFETFERGDGRYWFIGSRGAFRIGRNVRDSMPVPKTLQYYVLTAPQVRPVVFQLLDREPPSKGANLEAIAVGLALHSALVGVPARTILNHVNAWQKNQ